MEDSMRTRNALIVGLIAQIAAAGALMAQKPASKAAEPQKAAAKSAQPTTAKAAAPAVSADSAKKVLMANVSGATVKSERLHRKAGREVYDFSYTGSDKATHHATVDAATGEFKITPAATAAAKENHASASKTKSAPAAKKPGA
jgi:uncharacterized membrane protein YkoI